MFMGIGEESHSTQEKFSGRFFVWHFFCLANIAFRCTEHRDTTYKFLIYQAYRAIEIHKQNLKSILRKYLIASGVHL